ncbi:S9 family peptidase [Roseateles oligotrophus]|uniref:Alpha/beta fold hydrolase n=1 Tax=Roseateles oligotrophus TaxID=1769250 RepID=A0ABT2YEA1_9BURK|nr:alpha/beta fold hydrolase [Roseateles oligotrophus]MCV2368352.1 alpha/beta fold hydrolase [Roseateles oligotrophus]
MPTPILARASLCAALLSLSPITFAIEAPQAQHAQHAPSAAPPIVGDPASEADLALAAARAQAPAPVAEFWPLIAPDNRQVYFMANYEGRRALYAQEIGAKTPPAKVAEPQGRMRHPRFSPDGKAIYFSDDTQGDEAFLIKRLVLATGAVENVEAGAKLNRDGPWFTGQGARFFYTARAVTASGMALFERAAAPGAASAQVFASENHSLAAVRPDGQQALVVQEPFFDTLLRVDLPGGNAKRLFPAQERTEKTTQIMAAEYSRDGTRVFVATNDGGERTHVLMLDAKTGRELARYTDPRTPGGDVQSFSVQGPTLAYVLDLGTHHEVRILDTRTLKPRPAVKLPLGSEVPGASHPNSNGGLSLSNDGRHLALQWSSPSAPARILLIDTRTGSLQALTTVERAPTPAVESEVVQIPSFDGTLVPALVYRPKGAQGLPVIVQIHGGFPFASTARFNANIASYLAAGYAVVEPNVRGSAGSGPAYERADNGAKKLDAVRDFRAVGEWIARQPWADGQRMAVMGASAGGYHAVMTLAHHPQLWRAGVAVVPLYDTQMALEQTDGALVQFMERELVPVSEAASLRAISPSAYVDRIRAPMLVFAAGNDVRTPASQVYQLVRDLRERGQPVEFMYAPNEGHQGGGGRAGNELQVRILRFLAEALR